MYYSGNGENAIFRKSIFESGKCELGRSQWAAGPSAEAFHHVHLDHRVRVRGVGDSWSVLLTTM